MIKPLTQKDSVEISVESRNNSDIAKNNADEERAIATNATEDICDTQNNIDVNDIKMMQRNLITNFTIICRKTQDKEIIASLIRAPKIGVIVEKLSSNKRFYVLRPPKKSAFIVGDSMIKKQMVFYLPVPLIINTL